ncbi:MAG: DUF433 domain-containing protein, partial [Pirellulales bacterium]
GTGFKVRMLAEEHLATGADAIQLQRNHPQLTLGQVYSALAFYHDHKEAFDREIGELRAFAEKTRAEQGDSPLAMKLREMGKEMP